MLVDALGLELLHVVGLPSSVLDELRLYSLRLQGAPRHKVDAGLHDERGAQALADAVREALVGVGVVGQLDADRQRRVLLHALRARAHEDASADVGREGADDFAHGAGKTLTPRTMSMSSVRPMQRMRGPVRPHGQGSS